MPPVLLTIQTATPAGSLSLTDGSQLLAELNLDVRMTPTEWLLSSIEELMEFAGLERSDLDGVAVVRGPGSFTGLRVGLATAKGLAISVGCPLLGVSSLQCLAMQLPFSSLPICVLMDARKQEVYTATYRLDGGLPLALDVERVIKPDELLATIQEETVFVGNGALVYRELIVEKLEDKALFAPSFMNLPRASAAASLALRQWEAGQRLSADELMPNYLRPSEAELNLRNKEKSRNSG